MSSRGSRSSKAYQSVDSLADPGAAQWWLRRSTGRPTRLKGLFDVLAPGCFIIELAAVLGCICSRRYHYMLHKDSKMRLWMLVAD